MNEANISESKSKVAAGSRHVHDMVYIALGTVLIAVCSWISIPTQVPFTLQTMGVFLVCGLLGGRRGTLAVLVYILLGAIGVPVFSGFTGGIGRLLGPTGGYIVGFLASALIYWLFEKLLGKKLWVKILSMVLGLLACYAFGTIWFYIVYNQNTGTMGWATVLSICVIPFIPFDALKIALALLLSQSLGHLLRNKL